MGDRSNVTVSVLAVHAEQVAAMFADEIQGQETEDHICLFDMGEENCGQFDELTQLTAAGIAYDSYWDAGYEYEEGTASLRFTSEGEAEHFTIYESDHVIRLVFLLKNIDNPQELRSQILAAQEGITIPGWDNQEAYGKLYRAHQLISPTVKTKKR